MMFHQQLNLPREIEFELKFIIPGMGVEIPTLEEMEFFEVSSIVFLYYKVERRILVQLVKKHKKAHNK